MKLHRKISAAAGLILVYLYVYAVDPLRKRQIIAIRGMANLMNALLDLESWKDKSPVLGIRLHHGFERAATLVFEDVRSYLDPKLPIVVCGHSLGAARRRTFRERTQSVRRNAPLQFAGKAQRKRRTPGLPRGRAAPAPALRRRVQTIVSAFIGASK